MEDSKSVVPSSGAYGIPKWIMKKGMRYEVDDFIVSPPSIDDGGFLRLRYGCTGTQQAALEAPGQEGGMTVEVREDTLQFSSTSPPTSTTTISIGPGGLSVESSPQATPFSPPDTKLESPDVHPLLVLPMNFGGEHKYVMKVDSTYSSKTNKDSLGPTVAATPSELTQSLDNIPAAIYSSPTTLLERVQCLSVSTTPSPSVVPSPVTSPFATPRSSPTFPRKRLNITMDPQRKISAHSYFSTKMYQNDLVGLPENGNYKQEVSSSHSKQEVSPSHPKQVDKSFLPPEALNPKMMGQRKRQPKPSVLREMNFWAPTSM